MAGYRGINRRDRRHLICNSAAGLNRFIHCTVQLIPYKLISILKRKP